MSTRTGAESKGERRQIARKYRDHEIELARGIVRILVNAPEHRLNTDELSDALSTYMGRTIRLGAWQDVTTLAMRLAKEEEGLTLLPPSRGDRDYRLEDHDTKRAFLHAVDKSRTAHTVASRVVNILHGDTEATRILKDANEDVAYALSSRGTEAIMAFDEEMIRLRMDG